VREPEEVEAPTGADPASPQEPGVRGLQATRLGVSLSVLLVGGWGIAHLAEAHAEEGRIRECLGRMQAIQRTVARFREARGGRPPRSLAELQRDPASAGVGWVCPSVPHLSRAGSTCVLPLLDADLKTARHEHSRSALVVCVHHTRLQASWAQPFLFLNGRGMAFRVPRTAFSPADLALTEAALERRYARYFHPGLL